MNKAMLAAAFAALLILPATAQAQRYSAPRAAVLSGDLAAPWILQLGARPTVSGKRTVALARPVIVRRNAHRERIYGYPRAEVPVREQYVGENLSQSGVVTQHASVAVTQKPARKQDFDPQFEMQMVAYDGGHAPGTVIIDTEARFLYLVESDGMARRYGIGVGKPGFEWAGTHKVTRKSEWPGWTPPEQMRQREAKKGKILPKHMPGGPENPLGARAMYLGDTLYRIHGTNQPWSIGKAVSSGCIRMRNEDVMDLYERVGVGTKVIVS